MDHRLVIIPKEPGLATCFLSEPVLLFFLPSEPLLRPAAHTGAAPFLSSSPQTNQRAHVAASLGVPVAGHAEASARLSWLALALLLPQGPVSHPQHSFSIPL